MTDSKEAVVVRGDANYFQAWATIASGCPSSEIHDEGGLLIVCSGLPAAVFNVAFVKEPLTDPEAAVERSIKFFTDRNLPGLICVREGLCPRCDEVARKRGLKLSLPHPGMILHPISKMQTHERGSNIEIAPITSEEEIEEFAKVSEEAFGMPHGVPRQLTTQWTLRQPGTTFFIGRINGKPVATSALIRTGTVAGIYWVTVDKHFRRQGFGEAMTRVAINAGVDQGCDMANLQASEMGRPVYEHMGFKVSAEYSNCEVNFQE
ncbi:hypothetical protein ACHAWF_002794 [Thalassiosira exigua]